LIIEKGIRNFFVNLKVRLYADKKIKQENSNILLQTAFYNN